MAKTTTVDKQAKKRSPKPAPTAGMYIILTMFLGGFAFTLYLMMVDYKETFVYGIDSRIDQFAADLQKFTSTFDYRNEQGWGIVTDARTTIIMSSTYVALVILYIVIQKCSTKTEKKGYPFWVYPVSIIHHGILAYLSLVMMIGLGREFAYVCYEHGLDTCINLHKVKNTDNATGANVEMWYGVSAFYMFLFAASKYYEFFDTAIMMGKNYNLIFLHWWHHATVPVLMTVHALEHSSSAWTGSFVNALVHTVMYSYYTVNSIGFSLNSIKSLVTMLQLVQFVTVLGHIGWMNYVGGWDTHPLTYGFAYTVYGSYLILFINFFVQSYCKKPKKTKTA